jgi:ABC-2 type transport system permease protein
VLSQVLAISWLRGRLAIHSLRSSGGLFQLAGSLVIALIGAVSSIGMAIGFAAMAYFAVSAGDADFLRVTWLVVLCSCSFFGLFMPLMFAASGEGIDLRRLLTFPLTRGQLHGMSLASAFLGGEQIFYYPALFLVTLVSVVFSGRDVFGGVALVSTFVFVVVAWSHAVITGLQGLMRRRRSRELVVSLIFLVVILGGLLPAVMTSNDHDGGSEGLDSLAERTRGLVRFAGLLPPFIAASGLVAFHVGESPTGWLALARLALWLVPGLIAGRFLFARVVLGDEGATGTAPTAGVVSRTDRPTRGWDLGLDELPFVSQQVACVTGKELRYLLRSVVGRFNLVMTPVFVLIVVFLLSRELPDEAFLGFAPDTLALFGMLGYLTLFSNNFVNNAFAWERTGIQFYFSSPIALEKLLFGKNLGVWLFTGTTCVLAIGTWSVFLGVPDTMTLASSLLIFACCIVAFTTVGNFNSILFPVPRDCSSITNSPSTPAVLIGLGVLSLTLGAIAIVTFAPAALGYPRLQPLTLGASLVLLMLIYRWSLSRAAALMAYRAEDLMEKLRA